MSPVSFNQIPSLTDKPDKLAIWGASLGNQCITHELISEGRRQLHQEGIESVLYMVTGNLDGDGPSKWNFQALNLSPSSIRHNIRNLTRRLQAVLMQAGALPSEFINWSDTYNLYDEQRKFLEKLLNESPQFKKDIYEITRSYLEKKIINYPKLETVTDEMVAIGANYPLEELALMLAAPQIFNKDWVCYLYYEGWPVYENLIAGAYDGVKRESLGMFIVKTDKPS